MTTLPSRSHRCAFSPALPAHAEPVIASCPGPTGADTQTLTGHAVRFGGLLNTPVYELLCCRAAALLRRETIALSFDPPDLVHDAFLRIERSPCPLIFENRGHMIAVVCIVMRRILIDHARIRGQSRLVPLDSKLCTSLNTDWQAIDVRRAVARLTAQDARQGLVVSMQYFLGFRQEEIGMALAVSPRTVKRVWAAARRWLRRELTPVLPSCPAASPPARV